MVGVWSLRSAVLGVRAEGTGIVVVLANGARHEHERAGEGWRISVHGAETHTAIELGGAVRGEGSPNEADLAPTPRPVVTLDARAPVLYYPLRREHYRRSEESWEEAGRPRAIVALDVADGELRVMVEVEPSSLLFAPADATNEMDNEHPDVNGDGVQLHMAVADRTFGWRLVPEAERPDLRVNEVPGFGGGPKIRARWRRTDEGYVVECALELPPDVAQGATPFALDVIVNETAPGRERRRGQLVMSGGAGEFVYLRGDRQSMERALTFVVSPSRREDDV
jgi:hypothetical protein